MQASRQSVFFRKSKKIKRFGTVFAAMIPLVVFELLFEICLLWVVYQSGDWQTGAIPLGIVAFAAIFVDFCYLVFNWDNPTI